MLIFIYCKYGIPNLSKISHENKSFSPANPIWIRLCISETRVWRVKGNYLVLGLDHQRQ